MNYPPDRWYDNPASKRLATPEELAAMAERLERLADRAAVSLGTCRSGWCCDVRVSDITKAGIRGYGEKNMALAVENAEALWLTRNKT